MTEGKKTGIASAKNSPLSYCKKLKALPPEMSAKTPMSETGVQCPIGAELGKGHVSQPPISEPGESGGGRMKKSSGFAGADFREAMTMSAQEKLGPDLLPNSPQFARLSDYEKLLCLTARWRLRCGPRSMPTLTDLRGALNDLRSEESGPTPTPWYYEPNAILALERWLDNESLIRPTVGLRRR